MISMHLHPQNRDVKANVHPRYFEYTSERKGENYNTDPTTSQGWFRRLPQNPECVRLCGMTLEYVIDDVMKGP